MSREHREIIEVEASRDKEKIRSLLVCGNVNTKVSPLNVCKFSLSGERANNSFICFHRSGSYRRTFFYLAIIEARLIGKGVFPRARSFVSFRFYRYHARLRVLAICYTRLPADGKLGKTESLVKLRVSRYETVGTVRDRAAQKCNMSLLLSKTRPRRSEETDKKAGIAMTSWNGGARARARTHCTYHSCG